MFFFASPAAAHPDDHPGHKNDTQPSSRAQSPVVGFDQDTSQPTPSKPDEAHPQVDEPPRPWPPAPFAPGVNHKKTKTANKEYDDIVARMLSTAEHDFGNLISTMDAYPDLNTQTRWSIQCWEGVCREENHYYELSTDMRNLVCFPLESRFIIVC